MHRWSTGRRGGVSPSRRLQERIYLMNRLVVLAALLLSGFTISAQSVDEPTEEQKSYGDIFSDIMESLPRESKAQVDSASQTRNQRQGAENVLRERIGADVDEERAEQLGRMESKALDELPEDVRRRVEKAMKTIEERRESKVMKFKEKRGAGK